MDKEVVNQQFGRLKEFLLDRSLTNWKQILTGISVFLLSLFFVGSNQTVAVFPVLLIMGAGSLIIFLLGKNMAINALLVILGFGCIMAVTTPILDTPDETAHFSRAMYLVQGDLLLENDDSQLIISQDYKIIKREQGETLLDNDLDIADTAIKIIESDGLKATNAYSFISYMPQAIGLGIGRFLNATLLWSFYFGRITNVICYGILAALAIWLTPFYKNIFYVIATLPMAVYLAASYNQDAFGLGMIFLTIALFLKLLNRKEKSIGLPELLVYMVFCMLITLSKFPYVLLIILPIFIPRDKFKSRGYYGLTYLMILLTACFALWWMRSYSSIPHPFVPEGVNMGVQVAGMMAAPVKSLQMFGNNMINELNSLLMLFNFGWLTYGSNAVGLVYLVFLGGMIFMMPKEGVFSKPVKWGIGILVLGIYTAILLSMYLTWTAVGEILIQGVQGRYFIGFFPLLPVFLNMGPERKELDLNYLEKHNQLLKIVPIYFIYISLAMTIKQYY